MVWTKSEKQLKDLMSELNQKHPCMKFDYKFDCQQIERVPRHFSLYRSTK